MFKSLSLIAVVTATAFSANAQVYVEANASVESKVCAVAANQGFDAAAKFARKYGMVVSRFSATLNCNGQDIRELANVSKTAAVGTTKAVQLVAKQATEETQLCLKAVESGVNSLGFKSHSLRCNNMPVKEFVKQYQHAAI
ncbi:exonuclease III [Pseudoalteromonas fenneropenaei]|uniref:Exonuclease III n=1 Tax=Pseudoalteromonas fenneropenaei TaxID=1737459 RepID=A0ABV7CF69_9GAMM